MASSASVDVNYFVFSPIGEPQDKKRVRTDDQNSGASPNKKAKGGSSPKKPGRAPRVRTARPPTVNAAAKAALKEKEKEASVTRPKWQTLVPPVRQSKRDGVPFTNLRPRLWTSDREELLAILPEMCGSKCINGISWLLYQNPMILLDDTSYSFETTKVDDFTLDLTTTRSFTCPAAAVAVPAAELDFNESLFGMTVLQDSLGDRSMDAIESIPTAVSSAATTNAFDLNGHWIPTYAGSPRSFSCVGFDVSQLVKTAAMNHERDDPLVQQSAHSAMYSTTVTELPGGDRCERALVELVGNSLRRGDVEELSALIDNLDGDNLDKLVNICAKYVGIMDESALSEYPRGIRGFLRDCIQEGREKRKVLNLGVEAMPDSIDARQPVPIGDPSISGLANYCEQDPQPFGGMSIEGSGSGDNNPRPSNDLLLPVPSPIPPEIQALIDAYIFGKPLTVVVSNERVYEHWSLHLPREYGCVMMGFYRVIGVEEYPVQSPAPKSTSKDIASGRVRWRFRIRWSAGGEECIWQNRIDELNQPWWSPAHEPPSHGRISPVCPQPLSEPEDGFNTTLKYRNLRKQNPEYKWRHDPLQDLYCYLFPPHLLMPFTALLPDSNFPRGWICQECGKMNFQRSMRRRKCSSSFCKDSKAISYFLDLFVLRDPQDRLTLPLPYNTYPEWVKVKRACWDDETQTFSILDANTTSIKHVFTGNFPHLQSYAEEWLENIQLKLDIVRKPGDNGPYFNYSANFRNTRKPPEQNGSKWNEVPDCIKVIKDCMVSRAKLYAQIKEQDFRIDQLDILAWVTSGSKKHPVPINATKKAVIFLCLGCNITLNMTPRTVKALPVVDADEREENPQDHAGWIARDLGDEHLEESTASASPKKQTIISKDKISLSLVHGDILVLFGGEFEYSIKRHGTSFLLMGSCLESER